MAIKLKLLLREPQLALLLRTAVFAILLGVAVAGGFSFLSLVIFFAGAAGLFFSVPAAGRGYGWSCIVLLFLAALTNAAFAEQISGTILVVLFSLLFYILVALRMLVLS